MSTYLRRCVSLGANGVENPGTDQDYRYSNNAAYFAETNTAWVRIWAWWPKLQPVQGIAPDNPANPAYQKFLAFDDQINQARANGRNIVIVSHQFPRWANGTSGLVSDSQAEVSHGKEDRMKKADWLAYYNNGAYNGPLPKRKDLEYKVPGDLSTSSAWGQWMNFLINRYRDFADGRVVCIEICNEPNGQMWPLFNPRSAPYEWDPGTASDLAMDCSVAAMMNTAKVISDGYGDPQYLLAPATDDGLGPSTPYVGADNSTRLRVRYDTFTNALLGRLDSLNFQAHRKFGWSHHNYIDVEHDIGQFSNNGGGAYVQRAQDVRTRLINRWAGWPQSGGQKTNPHIFLTEGGARREAIQKYYPAGTDWRQKQKDLVKNQWQRHHQDVGNGVGIAMITNYLMIGSEAFYPNNFDTGLRDFTSQGATPRPVYDYWKTLPFIP